MNTRALRRMALHVDEQHREVVRGLPEELHDLHFDKSSAGPAAPSRRRFLGNAAAAGAAVTVGGLVLPVSALVPSALAQEEGEEVVVPEEDVAFAVFAASVERAAISLYDSATARNLVEEPLASTVRLFGKHHKEYAAAFEGLIAEVRGESEVTPSAPNPALLDALAPQIEAAETPEEVLTVLFTVEQSLAATYQMAMGDLESLKAAAIVARIEPVPAQHAVVLGQALDLPMEPEDETSAENWMPSFQSDSDAFDPETYPVS